MSRIEAIVSDFGGVLTTPLLDAFVGLQAKRGIPIESFGAALVRAAAENGGENPLFELETGRLTEDQFVTLLGNALRAELDRDVDLARFGETFFEHLHPNEELFAFMRTLHERRYRMAILTNNVREWEPLWRSMLPIDELFELVVDSGFEGVRKPDPRIYEVTLQRLGVAAEATLFLDEMEIHCNAARELGMRAVWFRSNAQTIEEIERELAG
jgi:putative hydrolase of the HAD superfamily